MEVNTSLPTNNDYKNWSAFYRFLISNEYTSRAEVRESMFKNSWDNTFEFPFYEETYTTEREPKGLVSKKLAYTMHGIEEKVLQELSSMTFHKQNLEDFLQELKLSPVANMINPALLEKVSDLA